jgi:Putative metal-binding motif/Secretion system C-terminal sorting domain
MNRKFLPLIFALLSCMGSLRAQESIARIWNEILIESIRNDFARPPIHARNLWHSSIIMYDSWAVFEPEAETYFLGKTVGNYTCNFAGIPQPANVDFARIEVMSYAMFRLIQHRFQNAPGNNYNYILGLAGNQMFDLGFNPYYTSVIYQGGDYKALGNYLAQCIINYGLSDGSNELNNHANTAYLPVNPSMIIVNPGNPTMIDPNRWQPLTLNVFIDQAGNVIPGATPPFQSPEWGQVIPFALKEEDKTVYERDEFDYVVYHDPGAPPHLDTSAVGGLSEEYKWGYELVSIWASHLDPDDPTLIDISPAGLGNVQSYPETIEGLRDFYNLEEGGDTGLGRDINPVTQMPYAPQMVKRADYARVLAEYWADGPTSETPPGHWFSILNYVSDNLAEKRFNGQGPILSNLEFDVKGYFMLGGAMHDAAITAWGIKGWYDFTRPVTSIRYMARKGQSSDPGLPSYHPAGLHLIPGYIELVQMGDPLAGVNNEHVGKIKLYTWKGPDYITNPDTDIAHVDWILAENWWPYQRPTFVTPPFAGYISGHSTYSRAGAEIMTALTGDSYFPGGMGEFVAEANDFLVFEEGPSETITMQWATYQDASDACSLSRIWGGIHPPCDDIPGRLIGMKISEDAFALSKTYFYNDQDQDGFFTFEDCDDNDNTVYPGAPELCDAKDNDCNSEVDEGLVQYTYYLDADNDGYGNAAISKDTCQATPITGYVSNLLDCNDADANINPGVTEICDGIDNNCSGIVDDNLPVFTYYADADNDSFGDPAVSKDTCQATPITGYVSNLLDCDDSNADIHPNATEVCDGIDNNCSGIVDDNLPVFTYYEDADEDGFGNPLVAKDTCQASPISGYVADNTDCDDTDAAINVDADDIPNNGIDEDCDGVDFVTSLKDLSLSEVSIFPNPVTNLLQIKSSVIADGQWTVFDVRGSKLAQGQLTMENGIAAIDFSTFQQGVYMLLLQNEEQRFVGRVVKF